MSDFFTRLAERTLGVEPVARPDSAPLVAAAPEKEGAGAPNAAAREEIDLRAFERLDDFFGPERAQLERRGEAANVERQTSRSSDLTTPADSSPRAPSPASFAEEKISRANDHAASVGKNPAATEVASVFARHEPVIAPPAPQRGGQSESHGFERFTAVSPAIHVSIGRVEVRAVTAPAPRPSVPERRAAARLSLEQYLRERNEGRR
jgi:hypothetical protein